MSDQTWEPTKMSLTIEEQRQLKASLCADPIGMLNELTTLRTRLLEVEADAAVMRQCIRELPWLNNSDVLKAEAALSTNAGKSLLERLKEAERLLAEKNKTLLAREQSLKNEGERWVKAMTERDEARTDLQSHKAALEKARVALKEAQNSLALSADLHNEIAAYGSCDCNLPKGEVCIPCQCEKQTSIDNAALALIHGTLTTINELLQKGSK